MTQIALQQLTLERFKGIQALTLDFGGSSASIFGDNAAGKTTIYDGYLWLLTGKDSLGRSDFDIKPLDKLGNVADHSARSAVEAVLQVDGRTVTLRREFYELWSKKRGRSEATYDGNSTDYYINGVPKAKRAYEEAVAEFIPLDKLRLLSDTAAFAALPWKQRRELLFDLAEVGTDRQLMGELPIYSPLLEETVDISLEDLRSTLKARRKKVNARLNDLPLLIAENRNTETGLGEIPFETLRASMTDLEEEEHRLTAEIASAEVGDTGGLRNRLDALGLDLTALEQDNREHRMRQQSQAPDRSALEDKLAWLDRRIKTATEAYRLTSSRYDQYKKTAAAHESNAEEYRRMWSAENAKGFDGAAACPTCGQPLPAEMREQARKRWEQAKADKLAQIQGLGAGAVEHARQMADLAKGAQDDMVRIEGELAQLKEEKAAIEGQLADPVCPEITDLPDYAARKGKLAQQIQEARQQLDDAQRAERTYTDELRRQRQSVRSELEQLRGQIAKEDTLKRVQARIGELEQERRQLADELARIDQLTDLADDFVRYKGEHITQAVNDRFQLARFRLFSEQVNGETPPACEILCGGVPYDSGLNSGARINVGLDIIRTLSAYYGYRVPVFVDNAESVVHLEPIDTQVIRLVVSEADRELRVEQ